MASKEQYIIGELYRRQVIREEVESPEKVFNNNQPEQYHLSKPCCKKCGHGCAEQSDFRTVFVADVKRALEQGLTKQELMDIINSDAETPEAVEQPVA